MSYNSLTGEVWKAINAQLLCYFDGRDPIRTAFRIGGLKRNGGRRGGKQTPSWAVNDKALRQIILRSFPRIRPGTVYLACSRTNKSNRCRCPFHQWEAAKRWVLIARMFWGMGMTQGDIQHQLNKVKWGEEGLPLKWPLSRIKHVINNMRRAAAGLRSDGSGRLTGRRPGRPAKCSK